MMPMIPGITDAPEAIEGVIRAARAAGASGVWWRSLFLKPAAARRFLPFVRDTFPAHERRLESFYRQAAYAPASYDDHLRPLFDRLKRKYGFDPEAVRREGHVPRTTAQVEGASVPVQFAMKW
jgi:DNA repair photolyase